jgi:hypothetical protein
MGKSWPNPSAHDKRAVDPQVIRIGLPAAPRRGRYSYAVHASLCAPARFAASVAIALPDLDQQEAMLPRRKPCVASISPRLVQSPIAAAAERQANLRVCSPEQEMKGKGSSGTAETLRTRRPSLAAASPRRQCAANFIKENNRCRLILSLLLSPVRRSAARSRSSGGGCGRVS